MHPCTVLQITCGTTWNECLSITVLTQTLFFSASLQAWSWRYKLLMRCSWILGFFSYFLSKWTVNKQKYFSGTVWVLWYFDVMLLPPIPRSRKYFSCFLLFESLFSENKINCSHSFIYFFLCSTCPAFTQPVPISLYYLWNS